MSITLAFLVKIDNDAAAGGIDRGLCRFHFLAACALDAVENMPADARRMDADNYVIAIRDVAPDKRDRLALAVVIEHLGERPEFGIEFARCETFDHKTRLTK